jgi:hypothetical protein
MTTIRNLPLALTVLTLLALAVPSGTDAADIADAKARIAAAPATDAMADHDIVVLLHEESIDVDDAGRVTRRVRTLRRLQTQWAMRGASDVRIPWDSSRQDLEIVTARTVMSDGRVIDTPANGFNEVTPDAVAGAPLFMHWRTMVVSHVGTDIGCTLELEYVLRDREPGPVPAGGIVRLAGDHPVLEARVVTSGVGATLDGGARDQLAVAVDSVDVRERLTITGLPVVRDGVAAGHDLDIAPYVEWTAATGSDHGLDAMGARIRAHRSADTATDAMAAWVVAARADGDVLTDRDLIARIAALIHDRTSGVSLPGGPWAAAPRPAGQVFATASGTSWERANLAMALLREAGWQPELGVFAASGLPTGRAAAPSRFTHLRVVVSVGGENYWIAPDRGDTWTGPCDLAGWTGMFLARDGGRRVYTVPRAPGDYELNARLFPVDGGWSATADLVVDRAYRPGGVSGQDLAERLAADLLPDGKVSSVEIRTETDGRLALRLTATGDRLGDADGDLLIRDLPWPDTAVLAHLPAGFDAARAARHAPLPADTPGREHVTLVIVLPDGWSAETPGTANVDRTAAGLRYVHRVRGSATEITLERSLDLAESTVSVEDYPQFRQLVARVRQDAATPLVITTR